MIPFADVSSRSYVAWYVAQKCVSLCQCPPHRPTPTKKEKKEWDSVTLSVFSHFFTFAVSAVSVWLGIALCFTASNLYSVPLFIQNSLPHLLLVSLHSSLALYPSFPLPVIFFPPPSFSSSFGFSSVLHICQLLPLFSLLLFHISSFCIFSSCCIVWCCPPLKYFGPPPPPPPFPFPFLKSVWSPLILSAPRVVVLGWMSALWIRGLKRAEQQPKPWNPLNLSFSLSCFNWHC